MAGDQDIYGEWEDDDSMEGNENRYIYRRVFGAAAHIYESDEEECSLENDGDSNVNVEEAEDESQSVQEASYSSEKRVEEQYEAMRVQASASDEGEQRIKKRKEAACPHCGDTLASYSNHNTHSRRVHQQERPHKCTWCNRRFFRAYELDEHYELHYENSGEECDTCKGYFVRNGALTRLRASASNDCKRTDGNE